METASGLRRALLRITERMSCTLAHRVVCVSHSLREVAVREHLCPPDKIRVLAGGSGQGVDARGRFNPAGVSVAERDGVRARFGIRAEAPVIGFIGRIVRDKGIVELAEAWRSLRRAFPAAHLLMVGPVEPQDPLPAAVESRLREDPHVHLAGMDWNTPPLYAAMDLLVLPTYREGFPNVLLEAASMGLPVVTTRVPGCVDAVQDGITGTLVPPREYLPLANAISAYMQSPELRREHGKAGRARALREFQREAIWEAIYHEYRELLWTSGAVVPARFGARPETREALASSPSSVGALLKRLLDITAAAVGLILLSPLLLGVAAAIQLSMGSPVLFRQTRPGLNGKPFQILKFRTMRDACNEKGELLSDAARVTPLGRFLRSTSLDELPELLNVLRGEMSLVGPRPLLMEYLARYTPEQQRRHDVLPGITGWAQINGRQNLSFSKRLELDTWYVDHRSFWLDLKILLATIPRVLGSQGVIVGQEVTEVDDIGLSGRHPAPEPDQGR